MEAYAERVPHSKPRRYRVVIDEGVQQFRLDYEVPTIAEARWMADMFNRALARHTRRRVFDALEFCGSAGFLVGGFLGFLQRLTKGETKPCQKMTSAALPANGK